MAMQLDSYIIVRVSADQKNYTWWEVRGNEAGGQLPPEPLQAIGNRTTSSSTLGTNVGNQMPTLAT